MCAKLNGTSRARLDRNGIRAGNDNIVGHHRTRKRRSEMRAVGEQLIARSRSSRVPRTEPSRTGAEARQGDYAINIRFNYPVPSELNGLGERIRSARVTRWREAWVLVLHLVSTRQHLAPFLHHLFILLVHNCGISRAWRVLTFRVAKQRCALFCSAFVLEATRNKPLSGKSVFLD